MKTLLTCLFIILLASCKKNEEPPAIPPKTVNDIVLTPNPLPIPSNTYDSGTFPTQSILAGNSIYFGNWSNTDKAQFFVRYDLSSNSFSSSLEKSSSLCGCGYKSHLISDGTSIFYIANDASKYTPSTNTWKTLTYPPSVEDNAGEAGVVYSNGTIYFVGGRTPSKLVKAYNINQDKWSTLPSYLYSTTASEMTAYKDRLYLIGGQGIMQKMAYFSTTANTWTALKDTPFEVSGNSGNVLSAILGDYLYLLQGRSVYIYDIANDSWASAPIVLDNLPSSANLFSNGQKLYISGKNASNTPAITELTVSSK